MCLTKVTSKPEEILGYKTIYAFSPDNSTWRSNGGTFPTNAWAVPHNADVTIDADNRWQYDENDNCTGGDKDQVYPAGFHIMAEKSASYSYPVRGRGLLAIGTQLIYDDETGTNKEAKCYIVAEVYVPSPDKVKAEKARHTRLLKAKLAKKAKAKKGSRR